jgi:putative membrane protein insertion efficiency factor
MQRLRAMKWWQLPMGLVGELFVLLCRLWKKVATPILPPMCRFEPSCSVYMIDAIRKRGVFVGIPLGIYRVFRCNPWTEGGYDPVK